MQPGHLRPTFSQTTAWRSAPYMKTRILSHLSHGKQTLPSLQSVRFVWIAFFPVFQGFLSCLCSQKCRIHGARRRKQEAAKRQPGSLSTHLGGQNLNLHLNLGKTIKQEQAYFHMSDIWSEPCKEVGILLSCSLASPTNHATSLHVAAGTPSMVSVPLVTWPFNLPKMPLSLLHIAP